MIFYNFYITKLPSLKSFWKLIILHIFLFDNNKSFASFWIHFKTKRERFIDSDVSQS